LLLFQPSSLLSMDRFAARRLFAIGASIIQKAVNLRAISRQSSIILFNTRPKLDLTLLSTAKGLTKYMASSNVGETQQLQNATIDHRKQRLPFDKAVGMALAVEFGLISATYGMKTIASSGNWTLLDRIFTMYRKSPILASLTQLLRSY